MKSAIYYLMLAAVILTWGFDPIVNSYFYNYFSAAALVTMATLASAILLFIVSFKKLRLINKRYFKVAVPICSLNSIACLFQRIGLQYTTPASYAFLEQLACVVVPAALFLFTKKRPTVMQCLASLICLAGCFIFSGFGSGEGFSLGIGELLCASAGILFGICIAATGAYAKGLDIGIYMLIHMTVYFIVSACMALALNFTLQGGEPLEKFVFSFDLNVLIPALLFGLFSVGICWLFRTEAVRNINPTVVAVMSPFSAVITGAVSLILGIDTPTKSFFIGAAVIIFSILLSAIAEEKASHSRK